MFSKLAVYNTVPTNTTGVYCSMAAGPPILTAPGVPYNPTNVFSRLLFYGYSLSGAANGQVQPQILNGDGTYRDYGPLISTGGQGFLIGIEIKTWALGAQYNIVTAFTGAGAFLEIFGEIR